MQWVACSLSWAGLTNRCGTLVAWLWTSRTHSLGTEFEDVSKSFLSWTAHCRLSHVSPQGCLPLLSIPRGRQLLLLAPIVAEFHPLSQNCFQNLWFQTNGHYWWIGILSLIFASVFQDYEPQLFLNRLSSLPHIESMCLWGHLPCSVAQVVCHNIEIFHHNIYICAWCPITCDNGSYIYRVEVSKYSLGKCVCNKLFRIWCTC